jgi:hypothetical protein
MRQKSLVTKCRCSVASSSHINLLIKCILSANDFAKQYVVVSSFFVCIRKFEIYQMEDTTRLTNDQSIKLFIQRDYSEGTAVKFQERFPSELEGRVNNIFFLSLI